MAVEIWAAAILGVGVAAAASVAWVTTRSAFLTLVGLVMAGVIAALMWLAIYGALRIPG